MLKMKQVKEKLFKHIIKGQVAMCYKTRWAPLGKQLISVGPYYTATETRRRYAVIDRDGCYVYFSPWLAVNEFVKIVGKELAWEAPRGLTG